MTEHLRPKHAAARFKVSPRTLARWAARGLIGRSRVGRVTHYTADEIAAVLNEHHTPRQVTLEPPSSVTPAPPSTWRSHPLFATTPPHPAAGGGGSGR